LSDQQADNNLRLLRFVILAIALNFNPLCS
jgi:hypothetical protein